MEAKDTVIWRDMKGRLFDPYSVHFHDIERQAEISFKIGKTAGVAESLLPAVKAIEESRKAGIREVLDWEEEHNVIGYVYDTDDPEVEKQNMIDHANQLKEWGLL